MYTTVPEGKFRRVASTLQSEGAVPDWFPSMEYVNWHGGKKDLNFVSGTTPSRVLLVDDQESFILDAHADQWVSVQCFEHPYPSSDNALVRVLEKLGDTIGNRDA